MNNTIDTEKIRELLTKDTLRIETKQTISILDGVVVGLAAYDQLLSLLPPPCEKCGGSGIVKTIPASVDDGSIPPQDYPCPACQAKYIKELEDGIETVNAACVKKTRKLQNQKEYVYKPEIATLKATIERLEGITRSQ